MPSFVTTRNAALAIVLTVSALTAGCSSADTSTRDPVSARVVASTTATTSTTTPGVTARQAALALARRMVAEAVLPTGAVLSRAPLPPLLRGPIELPLGGNIVGANQEWTIAGDPTSLIAFLKNHVPRGFVASGVSTSSSPTARAQYVIEQLRAVPPNVSEAGLEIGVEAGAAGSSFVYVYGGVQWTEPRPVNEYVPAADRVVIVSVIRAFRPGKPVIRRVVVTDRAEVAQIAQAFDALRVAPSPWVSSCYALTSNAVSYRIAFAPSPIAVPDVVATAAACSPLEVTVGGRARPALSGNSGAFGLAVAHAIGQTDLNFQ